MLGLGAGLGLELGVGLPCAYPWADGDRPALDHGGHSAGTAAQPPVLGATMTAVAAEGAPPSALLCSDLSGGRGVGEPEVGWPLSRRLYRGRDCIVVEIAS